MKIGNNTILSGAGTGTLRISSGSTPSRLTDFSLDKASDFEALDLGGMGSQSDILGATSNLAFSTAVRIITAATANGAILNASGASIPGTPTNLGVAGKHLLNFDRASQPAGIGNIHAGADTDAINLSAGGAFIFLGKMFSNNRIRFSGRTAFSSISARQSSA